MEEQTEEKLRQQLAILRRSVAKKKNKIKKIERAKSVKEHVKKKIQEHNETDHQDEIVTLHSLDGNDNVSETPKGSSPHVSFNLAKIEKIDTSTDTKTSQDVTTRFEQTHKKKYIQHNVSRSPEDFTEDSINQFQAKKAQHKRRVGRRRKLASTVQVSESTNVSSSPNPVCSYPQILSGSLTTQVSNKLLEHGGKSLVELGNGENSDDKGDDNTNSPLGKSTRQNTPELIKTENAGEKKSQVLCFGDSLLTNSGHQKKKQRRSTTDLDFSFLDEAGSGDMYSQVKTRCRRNQRSDDYSTFKTQITSFLGISQDDCEAIKYKMPQLEQGLSQLDPSRSSGTFDPQKKVINNENDPIDLKPKLLHSPPSSWPLHKSSARRKSHQSSNSYSSNTSPIQQLSLPSKTVNYKKQRQSFSDAKRDALFEKIISTEIVEEVSRKKNLFSSNLSKEQSDKSEVLMELPPSDVLKRSSHFVLPDTEYGLLKLAKIKMSSNKIKDVKNNREPTASPCSTEKGDASKLRKQCGLPDETSQSNSQFKSKRRKSCKLSPILMASQTIESPTYLAVLESSLIDSETQSESLLNEAMVIEAPDTEDDEDRNKIMMSQVITRQKQEGFEEISLSCGDSENRVDIHELINPLEGIVSSPTGIKTIDEPSIEKEDNAKNEDLVNRTQLDETMILDSTISQSSSYDSDYDADTGEMEHLKKLYQNGRVSAMDVVCGYLCGDRAVLAALVCAHCLQLWSQKPGQRWRCLHTWEIAMKEVIESVQFIGTGDMTTILVTSSSSVSLAGYAKFGTPWMRTIHNNTSLDKLLSCRTSDGVIVADVRECGTDLTRYRMSADRSQCHAPCDIGSSPEQLVSMKTITGQKGAVLGISTTTIYIWNYHEAVLIVEISLPLSVAGCLSAVAEHGFIFLWMSVPGNQPSLLVANPKTQKCVIVTNVTNPPNMKTRLGDFHVSETSLIGLSTTESSILVWDLAGCYKKSIALSDHPTRIGPIRGARKERILICTDSSLRQCYVH